MGGKVSTKSLYVLWATCIILIFISEVQAQKGKKESSKTNSGKKTPWFNKAVVITGSSIPLQSSPTPPTTYAPQWETIPESRAPNLISDKMQQETQQISQELDEVNDNQRIQDHGYIGQEPETQQALQNQGEIKQVSQQQEQIQAIPYEPDEQQNSSSVQQNSSSVQQIDDTLQQDQSGIKFARIGQDIPATKIHLNEIVGNVRSSGTCSAWGPHKYRTFSGRMYTFPGLCTYVLAQECSSGSSSQKGSKHKYRYAVLLEHEPTCHSKTNTIKGATKTVYCPRPYHSVHLQLQHDRYEFRFPDPTNYRGRDAEVEGAPLNHSLKDFRVFHGERELSLPIHNEELKAYPLQRYLVIKTSFGLIVKLDHEGIAVTVNLPDRWSGPTCGLCGQNGAKRPSEDFIASDGTSITDPRVFGNSWAEITTEATCTDVTDDTDFCKFDSDNAVSELSHQKCYPILSAEFFECHALVDRHSYFATCQDNCCYQNNRKGCECSSLTEFFKECQRLGGLLPNGWRTYNLCPMNCVNGTVYDECVSSLPRTCQNPEPTLDTPECVDGCHCPINTVLHQGQCISQAQCPCELRGKQYTAGQKVQQDCNNCVCQGGQWQCTTEVCDGRCTISGYHHLVTFDGSWYSLPESCSFILYYSHSYNIEIENVPCRGGSSASIKTKKSNYKIDPRSSGKSTEICSRNLVIRTSKDDKYMIKLKKWLDVTVNGEELNYLPAIIGNIFIKQLSSLYIQVEMPDGLKVVWNGETGGYISVTSAFFGKTQGLCGTYSHSQSDDFLTPEGDIELTPAAFARKWKVDTNCRSDEGLFESPCDQNEALRETAENLCKSLKSLTFEACNEFVDPQPYYRACIEEICKCQERLESCLCPQLEQYSIACRNKGINMNWRSDIPECGVHCNGGQQYQICVESCDYSCPQIASQRNCTQTECVDGCACLPGASLNSEGHCIPTSRCPCVHNGREYPPGFKQQRKGKACECIKGQFQCHFEATSREEQDEQLIACSDYEHLESVDCISDCPLTCSNMNLPPKCAIKLCRSGCRCKKGFVMDETRSTCVRPEQCPCHHGGRSYQDGSAVQMDCNNCLCKGGHWVCEKESCWGQCSAYGSSHYKTFDGKDYDVEGDCDYVLARGRHPEGHSFSIVVQNVPCGSSNIICSKEVTFISGQETVTLNKEYPFPAGSSYSIKGVGLFIHLYSKEFGVEILWDRKARLYVRVAPDWKGQLQGLCGDFNGDATNDFTLPNGGLLETHVQAFADSWKLHDYCPKSYEVTDICGDDAVHRQWAIHQCNVLKTEMFAPCHAEVPVQEYHQRCVINTCSCESGGNCDCLCTAIAVYADACAARGVPIFWRSQDLCPIQCRDCDHYNPCIPVCDPDTCMVRQTEGRPSCKGRPCVEGCEPKPCPSGQLFNSTYDKDCVPEANCVARWECVVNGKRYEHGEWIGDATVADPCRSCYCQKGRVDCKGQTCAPTVFSTTQIPITTPTPYIAPFCDVHGWTQWMNSYTPTSEFDDDYEDLLDPHSSFNLKYQVPCSNMNMTGIECRPVSETKTKKSTDEIECALPTGMICRSGQGKGARRCQDYEIRIYCNCAQEIVLTKQPYIETTESPTTVPPSSSQPEECPSYNHGWTEWVSTENPHKRKDGDRETIEAVVKATQKCASGYIRNIQCRVSKTNESWDESGQKGVSCDLSTGLTCVNGKQPKGKKCLDYEVRIFCFCETVTSSPTPSTESLCPPRISWSSCVFRCDQTCLVYQNQLVIEGKCDLSHAPDKCVPGCQFVECQPGYIQSDAYTCVKAADCDCILKDGSVIGAGTIVQKDCKKCNCVNNTLLCVDVEKCGWTTAHPRMIETSCPPPPIPSCSEGYTIREEYDGPCKIYRCIPECPAGLDWFDCHARCEKSCDTFSQRDCTEGCISGCFCPLNLIRDGDKCVNPSECPNRVCQGFGDPQLMSFDGAIFNIQGRGTFVMANHLESSLKISGHTDYCQGKVACIVGLMVEYQGHKVDMRILQNVALDNKSVSLERLPVDLAGMTIYGYPGHNYLVVIPELFAKISYFSSHAAFSIEVPVALFFNRTKGLCGNCNFVNEDEGIPNRPDLICSWLSEGNVDECLVDNNVPLVPSGVQLPEACLEFDAPLFEECVAVVDPEPFRRGCMYDVVHGGIKREAVCKALMEFTRRCCQSGIPVYQWMETIGCVIPCPEGSFFQQCHDACPQTCTNASSTINTPSKFERIAQPKGKTSHIKGKTSHIKGKTSDIKGRPSPIYQEQSYNDCKQMKMDGCFCQEGMVFHRGRCMSASVCETCDDAGHKPGDNWNEGPCKQCHCDVDLKVVCTTPTCERPPICRAEEQLKILPNDTEFSCCTVYRCELKPSPTCPPAIVPSCAPGEVAKMKSGKKICPSYICECDPSLCPMVRWPSDLEPGQQVELINVQCCSKAKIVCHHESCPRPPKCAPGLELKSLPGECCETYRCKPPEDVCIYTAQITVLDGEEVPLAPQEQIPYIYKPGEVWQDGLCRNCTCEGGKGHYTPECTLEQCPHIEDMPDKNDYLLSTVPIPGSCCPHIIRLLCKDQEGRVQEVGSEWKSPDNNCLSYRCELSTLGDVHKVERAIVCTDCPESTEYVTPPPNLGLCCGWCRPVICEENGLNYPVGSKWNSTVHKCYTAECIMDGGSVKTMYTSPKCSAIDQDCPAEHIIWDETGCCQKCNITMSHCVPVPVPLSEQVGFLTINDQRLGRCQNFKTVPGLKECSGTCDSYSLYSMDEGVFQSNCHCCMPQSFEVIQVELECAKGRTVKRNFEQPTTCKCMPCAGENTKKEEKSEKSIKGGIKGGRVEQSSSGNWKFPEETQEPNRFEWPETAQQPIGQSQEIGQKQDQSQFDGWSGGQQQIGQSEEFGQRQDQSQFDGWHGGQQQIGQSEEIGQKQDQSQFDGWHGGQQQIGQSEEIGQKQDQSQFDGWHGGQQQIGQESGAWPTHGQQSNHQSSHEFGQHQIEPTIQSWISSHGPSGGGHSQYEEQHHSTFEKTPTGHNKSYRKTSKSSSQYSSSHSSSSGQQHGSSHGQATSDWNQQLADHQRQVNEMLKLQKEYHETAQAQHQAQLGEFAAQRQQG